MCTSRNHKKLKCFPHSERVTQNVGWLPLYLSIRNTICQEGSLSRERACMKRCLSPLTDNGALQNKEHTCQKPYRFWGSLSGWLSVCVCVCVCVYTTAPPPPPPLSFSTGLRPRPPPSTHWFTPFWRKTPESDVRGIDYISPSLKPPPIPWRRILILNFFFFFLNHSRVAHSGFHCGFHSRFHSGFHNKMPHAHPGRPLAYLPWLVLRNRKSLTELCRFSKVMGWTRGHWGQGPELHHSSFTRCVDWLEVGEMCVSLIKYMRAVAIPTVA